MDMQKIPGGNLVIPALILGVCFMGGTIYAAKTAYRMKSLSNTISVTGSAERILKSDVAKWSGSFSRTVGVNELKQGYSDMKKDWETVQGFLKNSGLEEKAISQMPITVSQNTECVSAGPEQPCASTRLSGYTLRQSFGVESTNVDKVTAIAQQAGAKLADAGIVLEGSSPEFYYSKLADLKLEMLAEATKSATQRANQIITNSGAKLGNVVEAGMGVFQITAVNSTEISDYGSYDTSSIDKKVTAIVRASYTIK